MARGTTNQNSRKKANDGNEADLEFEEKLRLAAGKCRNSKDAAMGKLDGEFFTPRRVVRLLVEMPEPHKGPVFAPSCRSGGVFALSAAFPAESERPLRA